MKLKTPEYLYIEPTNICNANCIFCAYQFDKREKSFINFDLFKKVVDQFKDIGGEKIGLTPFAGEIFLDRDILKKLNYIKNSNTPSVHSYTNALSIHKFDIEDILNSGLTNLHISLSPLDEELYFSIFRNRNYKRLLSNLSCLLDTFSKHQNYYLQNIYLEFRSTMPYDEIIQMPDYIETVSPFISQNIKVSVMTEFDNWMGMIKESDLLPGMTLKSADFPKVRPCNRLNVLQVLSNGDTRVCGCRFNNNSDTDIFHVGNAMNEDLVSMYNKALVQELKNSFTTNNLTKECKLCSWYSADD